MMEDCHPHKLEGSGNIHHVKECVMVLMELMVHVVEFHNFHLKALMVLVLGGSHLHVMGFHEREVCHHSYLLNCVMVSRVNLYFETMESACMCDDKLRKKK